jgi:hypothetical protein
VSSQNPKTPEDNYLNRLDGYFVCDEFGVLVHQLRELICHSRQHSTAAFLSSADDIYSDLVEAMEGSWETLRTIAEALER